jgi:hypothetical protein
MPSGIPAGASVTRLDELSPICNLCKILEDDTSPKNLLHSSQEKLCNKFYIIRVRQDFWAILEGNFSEKNWSPWLAHPCHLVRT